MVCKMFRNIFVLIHYLQTNNIPHNIYVTRASNNDFNHDNFDVIRNCVRVFVWARTQSGKYNGIHV